MRIAVVGPTHPYKGGAAQHTTALARQLRGAGHEVELKSWRAQYPKVLYPGQLTVDAPEGEPFAATEWPLAWYRPDSWWRTGRGLARQRFDVVVVAIVTPIQSPAYLTLARAAKSGGCTVVGLCHNVLPHESRPLDRSLTKALLRRMDALVVHSEAEAALAASLTSAPVEVAALPPHWPGAGRKAAAGGEPAPAGEPLHRQLLFFGMVRRYKGLDLLLRALAAAGEPEVRLTIAGEIWEGRDELLRLISDLRLTDRVDLAEGYVPAAGIPALFAGADALVLPYRSGTASQNALIAFEFGVPVIATRAGAIGAAVQDGVNGILCEPGDVAALSGAITTLYQPGVLARLRRGVRTVDPAPLWDDYLAALGKAIVAGRS